MTTYVGLLRAVNVGGNRKLPMAGLRDIFTAAGCEDVRTYIQSGNVVFTHARRAEPALAADLSKRIEAAAGFDVPVILRTAPQWAAAIRDNPFDDSDPTRLLVAFAAAEPTAAAIAASEAIDAAAFAPETFAVSGREVYLLLPAGIGRSKLTVALRKLLAPATVRNWRSVLKLADMAGVAED